MKVGQVHNAADQEALRAGADTLMNLDTSMGAGSNAAASRQLDAN